jgi:D-alanine-D-alanine ligase
MYNVGLVYNKPKKITAAEKELDPRSYRQPEIIANQIKKALEEKGHNVTMIPATFNLLNDIQEAGDLDVIFNSCTGINSKKEQPNIVAMLELLDIPFVGSHLAAQVTAINKGHAKSTFEEAGVRVSPFQTFFEADAPMDDDLEFPLFVKPVSEGSAVGITKESKVDNESELREQVAEILEDFNQPALVEGYLPGREFSVGVLGTEDPKILPILEILVPEDEYGTTIQTVEVKADNAVTRQVPADVPDELAKEIEKTVLRAYKSLDCSEYARVDVKLDKEGKPNVIELNALPALEEGYAHYPLMAEKAGYDFGSLVETLAEEAIKAYQKAN